MTLRTLAATTTAALAIVATPAGAATVSLVETPGVDAPKGQGSPPTANVTVTALPGETNRITATRASNGALVLRDPAAPLTPGAGCTTTAVGEVTCTSATRLTVDAGDGNDLVDAAAPTGLALVAEGGPGDDTLRGGTGDDRLRPGTGRDEVDGGPGARDTVLYDERTAPVTVDLEGRVAETAGEEGEGDVVRGIEVVEGGAGADTLMGSDADEQLIGNAGADDLAGRGGDDFLSGGAGDDQLSGDDGDDTLIGDNGRDTLEAGAGNDFLAGRAGADVLSGAEGDDTIDLTGDPGSLDGELVACGAGPRDRVDSPAAFELVAPDCERIDVPILGQDVQPIRLYGTPRVVGRRILVRVGCDSSDCGDRVRLRVTIRTPAARPVRATATLRAGQVRTLRLPRGRAHPRATARVTISGTQIDAGEGLPLRGGFRTQLR